MTAEWIEPADFVKLREVSLTYTLPTDFASRLGASGANAIGGLGTDPTYDWPGKLDEVRYSNVVRYTTAFTPSTTAFTPDANTVALYHLEADATDSSTPPPNSVGRW